MYGVSGSPCCGRDRRSRRGRRRRRLAVLARLALGELAQRALVVLRHDLDPGDPERSPSRSAPRSAHRRSGPLAVLLDQRRTSAKSSSLGFLEVDDLLIAARDDVSFSSST